jgi:hypothetical protein
MPKRHFSRSTVPPANGRVGICDLAAQGVTHGAAGAIAPEAAKVARFFGRLCW